MKAGLTVRQAEVLSFVRDGIATGLAPSARDICKRFGFRTHAAWCHINALERKGCLSRVRYASRTLCLTHATGHPVRVDLASGTVASGPGDDAGVAYRMAVMS